jgi:hypothetical protein
MVGELLLMKKLKWVMFFCFLPAGETFTAQELRPSSSAKDKAAKNDNLPIPVHKRLDIPSRFSSLFYHLFRFGF